MTPMKVLMFGWEFPPYSVGGLGKVTYYLSNALTKLGTKISLIVPIKGESDKLKILPTNLITIRGINTMLSPYLTEKSYQYLLSEEEAKIYGGNLKEEISRFTERGVELAKEEDFDVIHCHDWMTFTAGIKTKEFSGKPLILHVHTTEFDRSCGGCNPYVYNIEAEGFSKADKIIAVSNYTKNKIIENYDVDENKIEVVHNAIEFNGGANNNKIHQRKKVVLYFGRISMHKGPDYFIRAAKKVTEYDKNIVFVMAGGGELLPEMVNLACDLGIGDKLLFTGRLKDEEVKNIYNSADLYVMPSVSEPFGITVLEAASNRIPAIVSNNSGVKEVLNNCFTADFWDTDEIANKVLSILKYSSIKEEMVDNAYKELKNISWDNRAVKINNIYNSVSNL